MWLGVTDQFVCAVSRRPLLGLGLFLVSGAPLTLPSSSIASVRFVYVMGWENSTGD